MDDFDINKIPSPEQPEHKPIPFDDNDDEPGKFQISNKPLDLGGSGNSISAPKPTAKIATKAISSDSTERITGVKTFFTKLHSGAIEFLDEQINNWLKNNPQVHIKRTNTVSGDVVGKKTEPSIIVTIWY